MSFELLVILVLGVVTRFVGLNWGSGLFFHPDENNMIGAITQLSSTSLNPHFFAYGQFPLYLVYFIETLFHLSRDYASTAYHLRATSAVFSFVSIVVFYQICSKIFDKSRAFAPTLVFVFLPGLIQLAHFGTTESLLILVFLLNLLLAFNLYQCPFKFHLYFWAALVSGVGLATKLSSFILVSPVIIVFFVNLFLFQKNRRAVLYPFLFGLLTIGFSLIFSPFNLISWSDFVSAFHYEYAVASGTLPVFYTNQFIASTPYLFQLTRVFPYVVGLPLYLMVLFLFVDRSSKIKYNRRLFFLTLVSVAVYFLYFGRLYVKWTRFMSPIFFIFPLISVFLFSRFRPYWQKVGLLLLAIVPGVILLRTYYSPDIRQQASTWLNTNLPSSATVLTEGGNVIDLPTNPNFTLKVFDFYTLENSRENYRGLLSRLAESDYIIVPSRRVFMNQSGPDFPLTTKYYQALFSGKLGYTEIKRFSPPLEFLLDPELAEETWSVFDRPTIRLFQKTESLTIEKYDQLLQI